MSMVYSLDQFWSDLSTVLTNRNQSYTFTEFFSLNIGKYNPQRIAQLQLSLQQFDSKKLSKLIQNNPTIKSIEWPAFELFILKYLLFVRDIDPWSILKSIDLFISVLECQSMLLNTKNNNKYDKISKLFLDNFKESMDLVIQLSHLIDTKSMEIHNREMDFPRLTYVSTILLKSLNNIRSTADLNTAENYDKIQLLFDISSNLCDVYYKIGSPVLCSNVFSNVNILNLNRRLIKKSKLLRFRFIMGKYYAHQSNFISSFHHLNECFKSLCLSKCPSSAITTILKYLIPVGLIQGKIANIQLLRSHISNTNHSLNKILDIYEPILKIFKQGNLYGFYSLIYQHENFWKSIRLWIPILQKTRVLLLRNLLLKTWKLQNGTLSWPMIRLSLLNALQRMDTLPITYQFTSNLNNDNVDEYVRNLVADVVFSGYIKLKFNGQNLVLGKTDTFPDMHTTLTARFAGNPKEAWLD